MNAETFNQIVSEQIQRCLDVLVVKAKEYATDDRLHNFKVAARLQDISETEALAGMMAKHTVSVYDMCCDGERHPLATWNEKITDSINYLLLLSAVIRERPEDEQELEGDE